MQREKKQSSTSATLNLYWVSAAGPVHRSCGDAGERRGRQRGEEGDVYDGVTGARVCLLRLGNERL